jgi:prepilin-type N-terminal cleavage/methylation domain-containing protein
MWRVKQQAGFTLTELLLVVGLIGVLSAVALPMIGTALASEGIKSDAQALSNLVGLAKMRASAGFTRARVRAHLTDGTFVLERWDRTAGVWVVEGGLQTAYRTVRFGFSGVPTAPPNTQAAIGMSPECRSGIAVAGATIGNTACIVFNSRGLPVDGDGAIFGGHGLYLTDGSLVYAVTVTATPRIRTWATRATAADWREQQ